MAELWRGGTYKPGRTLQERRLKWQEAVSSFPSFKRTLPVEYVDPGFAERHRTARVPNSVRLPKKMSHASAIVGLKSSCRLVIGDDRMPSKYGRSDVISTYLMTNCVHARLGLKLLKQLPAYQYRDIRGINED
jgi:hypothetical protein